MFIPANSFCKLTTFCQFACLIKVAVWFGWLSAGSWRANRTLWDWQENKQCLENTGLGL